MENSNILKFPNKNKGSTLKGKRLNNTEINCQVFSILDFNKNFNYLILKIQKEYPELNINSFSDFDNYKIDSKNNQFIFSYNGVFGFISMSSKDDIDLINQARELECILNIIENYGNIILSWFPNFNMQILLNINNFYINENENLIHFSLCGQKYTCSLKENTKSNLKLKIV